MVIFNIALAWMVQVGNKEYSFWFYWGLKIKNMGAWVDIPPSPTPVRFLLYF